MCGRYTLKTPADLIREVFDLPDLPGLAPRYNIAPSQPVAVVREHQGVRRLDMLRWGLVPYWAEDLAIGHRMINARCETLAERPAYREPFERRRCLVPADGFFEWQRIDRGRKQPFHLRLEPERPFAFAGLWDRWRSRDDGSIVESCTIVTTEANRVVAPIHDRMPVILGPERARRWLAPETPAAQRSELLVPWSGEMTAVPVSVVVNDPRNEDPRCLDRVAVAPATPTLFD